AFFIGGSGDLGLSPGKRAHSSAFSGEYPAMTSIRRTRLAPLLAAAALAPFTQAHAAGCAAAGAAPLAIGTVAAVAPGAPRSFSLSLGAHDGVIVDLAAVTPKPAASGDGDTAKAVPHAIRLCDAQGNVL